MYDKVGTEEKYPENGNKNIISCDRDVRITV